MIHPNTLHLGDCLQIMAQLPDNSVDCVVTDPPYMNTDIHFDKVGFNVIEWKKQVLRILKPNGYLISFGGIQLLASFLPEFSIRFSGVWLKQAPVIRTKAAKKPMSKMEMYCVYVKKQHKISELVFNPQKTYGHENYKTTRNKSKTITTRKDSLKRADPSNWTQDNFISECNDGSRWQTDVIEGNNKIGMPIFERTKHPTQKPVNVIEVLIKMLSNENDLILDPFLGSGTTALACINTNRRFIGCEIDTEYYEIAKGRIEKALDAKTEKLF